MSSSCKDLTLEEFYRLPDEAVVRPPVVRAVLGCSRSTIVRLQRTGQLVPCRLNSRFTVYTVGSIRALLKSVVQP